MMEFRTLLDGKNAVQYKRNTFNGSYDVVVVGGGTAGSVAAIYAAKFGLKTLCIEFNSFLGGLGTGIVLGYYRGENVSGFYKELDDRIKEESETLYCDKKSWCEGIHHEAKKNIYEESYRDFGGDILYQSIVQGVFLEKNRVAGISVLSEGETLNILCKYIIDASGDSLITRLCGGEIIKGRPSDGKMQNFSSALFVKNSENEIEHIYRDTGNIDTSNMEEYFKKLTKSYSELEKEGGYSLNSNNRIISLCSVLGIREGVIAKGKDELKLSDFLGTSEVNQPTFLVSGSFDKHLDDPGFEEDEVKDLLASKMYNNCVLDTPMPYGAMLTDGIEGIINAGLCVDSDSGARPIMRLKKNCIKSGITAAIIADCGLKKNKPLSECYNAVKKQLVREEIFAGKVLSIADVYKSDYVEKMKNEDNSVSGRAIYYAYKFADENTLLKLLENADGIFRENLIIALTLKGNKTYKNAIKELSKTYAPAIYLLGKINDGEFDDCLFEILKEDNMKRFSYAYDALSKRAVSDKNVERRLNEFIFDTGFSRNIVFNGKSFKTVADATENIRKLRKNKK